MKTENWTIRDIESLTESEAAAMALEAMTIKDHHVYLVDFGGYFGYSVLVFANGHHIHYANDYQLHHPGKSREELKTGFLDKMNRILFTEKEIGEPIRDYDEYRAKSQFLHNYYGMREDYVSMFRICHNEEEEREHQKETENMVFNPVCYCYHSDPEFVAKCAHLLDRLEQAKAATETDFDYWKSAFKYEMYNHEFAINWQGDYDVLSAFGNPKWRGEDSRLLDWFDDLALNEIQRSAYLAARAEYYKETAEDM